MTSKPVSMSPGSRHTSEMFERAVSAETRRRIRTSSYQTCNYRLVVADCAYINIMISILLIP